MTLQLYNTYQTELFPQVLPRNKILQMFNIKQHTKKYPEGLSLFTVFTLWQRNEFIIYKLNN